jgi:hypothetical protein
MRLKNDINPINDAAKHLRQPSVAAWANRYAEFTANSTEVDQVARSSVTLTIFLDFNITSVKM